MPDITKSITSAIKSINIFLYSVINFLQVLRILVRAVVEDMPDAYGLPGVYFEIKFQVPINDSHHLGNLYSYHLKYFSMVLSPYFP